MKSDNYSKYTESNTKTILVTEEIVDNQSNQGNVKFKFSDNSTVSYDLSAISSINPFFFSTLSNHNQIEILLPSYITPSLLMEFLFIIKNGLSELEESNSNNSSKIISLIRISDFFQNETFSYELISDLIMPRLNADNSYDYLKFSYDKLSQMNEENEDSDSLYFDLFYKCLEIIGKNVQLFIKQINKYKLLDKKILDEIIHKCIATLVLGNFIYVESDNIDTLNSNEIEGENYFDTQNEETKSNQINKSNNTNFISKANIESLFNILYELNGCNNFFDLLTKEYMNILSPENLKELNNLANPTFEIKIPYDFENYYEEYQIDFIINEKQIVFVLFYKKSDDSFNVNIKLSDINVKYVEGFSNTQDTKSNTLEDKYFFKIFSFLSIVKINYDSNINGTFQTNLKCLSNNKSMHSIFKLTNFKTLFKQKIGELSSPHEGLYLPSLNQVQINNEGMLCMNQNTDESFSISSSDFFTVTINLKLCFIYTALSSYLLKNFSSLSDDKNMNKVSKQLLQLVIKNKYLNKKNEDDKVKAIINWLNDEINIKEDITELFEFIAWEKVSEDLMLELIIKYSHMISEEDCNNIFVTALSKKYGTTIRSPIQNLVLSMIKAAHNVDYPSVFTLMKKNDKFNQMYLQSPHKNEMNISNISSNKNETQIEENEKKVISKKNTNKDGEVGKINKPPIASPMINFLLRHNIEEERKQNNSRNKKSNQIRLKLSKEPKKITHINRTASNNYSKGNSSLANEGIKNSLYSTGSTNHQRTNKSSSKRTNNEIMEYITKSKVKSTKMSNSKNKVSYHKKTKSLNCFPPNISYNTNKKCKINY